VEDLEGNLLTCQRHPRTAGPGQRHRPEVVGGPSAAAGDCCAGKAGEFGVLNLPCLLRKHSLQYTKDFNQGVIGQNPQTFS
jgi:hypothetical protein